MRHYRDIPLWADVADEQWQDWRWQVRNRITTAEALSQVINLRVDEIKAIKQCLQTFRMAITPYYATLMDPLNSADPVRLQAVPRPAELESADQGFDDPLHEQADSPVPGITHRYPDRVLFLVTDQCSMYCRHCTRRRFTGTTDRELPTKNIEKGLEYIRRTQGIRDVLLSGGDSLCISDQRLEYLLSRLRAIKHLEIVRLGTRTPVVLPQRITSELCDMIRKYHPVWLNTHFNHPQELTPAARAACARLADAGIPLGNQTVLLKGVNDSPAIIKELNQQLLMTRVRPYYLYQCDMVPGIDHFRTPVATGIEIMERLRGHTSGLAVPNFVIDAPGGGGKIPILPQYLISQSEDRVILRNYEGMLCTYIQPRSGQQPRDNSRKQGGKQPIGLEKLITGERIAIVPKDTVREQRRMMFASGGD